MNAFKLIFLIAILGFAATQPEVENKNGVLVLTQDTFKGTLDHYEYVLVMFFAPWCGHCKKLHPEFEAAAATLEAEGLDNIKLAHVDATEETALASDFGVSGYPTLKFFINGEAIDYQGPRESAGILTWIKKKTQPSTTELTDQESLDKAQEDNDVVVVFFGEEDSEEFGFWSMVTKSFDDFVFFHVFDSALWTSAGVEENTVVLFKQFDEGRNDFTGEFTTEALNTFISSNSVPTIMRFDQKAAQNIFGEGNPALFVFTSLEGEEHENAMAALEEASTELKGQILMAWSGVDGGLDQRLAEYVGATAEMLPMVMVVDVNGQDMKKFIMDGDISADNIKQFHADWLAGSLSAHVKSEEVPETQEDAVWVVVGKAWNDVVLDATKDVLMEYYAPWCGHCKALAPVYEEVAQKLADEGCNNVLIGKMDATANEVEGLSVQGFPTLKFYHFDNKEPQDYEGERTAEGFYDFLRSNAAHAECDFLTSEAEVVEEVEEEAEVVEELETADVHDDL